jgi:type IV pilus assembly protein PilA
VKRRGEEGFTLIELMVVVLIIAILIAIAIPTYLGARQRAQDRAAQSNVRNAFTATRVYYGDEQRYTDIPGTMKEVEPSLDWTDVELAGTSSPRAIQVVVFDEPTTAQSVVLVVRTTAGHCFYIRDTMAGLKSGTHYDRRASAGGICVAPKTWAETSGWSDTWSS